MYCTNRFEIYTRRNFNYGFVRVAGEDLFIDIIDSYYIRLDTYMGHMLRNIAIYVSLINCPLVADIKVDNIYLKMKCFLS